MDPSPPDATPGSRYPGNPCWDHVGDLPVALSSPAQWADAEAGGHLTVEHYLARIEAMLLFALGNGADLGYNADGFLNALTADSFRVKPNVWLRIYPNDHDPPHAHLDVRSAEHGRIRLRLDNGDLLDGDEATRAVRKDLKVARAFLREHAGQFAQVWQRTRPGTA